LAVGERCPYHLYIDMASSDSAVSDSSSLLKR
jgi:hypothetical protein